MLIVHQFEILCADIRTIVHLPGHLKDLLKVAFLGHEATVEMLFVCMDWLVGRETGTAENIIWLSLS